MLESSFLGRRYWVQVVTDRAGSVREFAVTSCTSDFRPRFPLPGGGSVTLQSSTLADVAATNGYAAVTEAAITVGASLAGNSLFELLDAGNPADYKIYAWGVDVACPPIYPAAIVQALDRERKQSYHGPIAKLPTLARLQSHVVVNTYAETAPAVFFSSIAPFGIGVDSVLTRTVDATSG